MHERVQEQQQDASQESENNDTTCGRSGAGVEGSVMVVCGARKADTAALWDMKKTFRRVFRKLG